MPSVENVSPDAAYATKNNIIHQRHTLSDVLPAAAKTQALATADAEVAAAEARANADLSRKTGLDVSGAAIKKGK